MKRFLKGLCVFVLALSIAAACLTPAFAESFAEFIKTLESYQKAPLDRAEELRQEYMKTLSYEDAVAKQNGVPLREVIDYEMALHKAVSLYSSQHYYNKADLTDDTTIIDDDTVRQFLAQKPPYDITFYSQITGIMYRAKATLELHKAFITRTKKEIDRLTQEKFTLEKRYRLCLDRLDTNDDIVKNEWNMKVVKVCYEVCFEKLRLKNIAVESRQNSANALERRITALEDMLDTVRKNIKLSGNETDWFTNLTQQSISKQHNKINVLSQKHDLLAEKLTSTTNMPSPMAKYCYSTEQNLIENEIAMLINLSDYWVTLRSVWELAKENIANGKDRKLVEHIREICEDISAKIDNDYEYCINEIKKTSNAAETSASFFESQNLSTVDSDRQLYDELSVNLKSRLARYADYLYQLIQMDDLFSNMISEIDRIYGTAPKDSKLNFTGKISEIFVNVRDYELFYVEDYPVTLGKIFTAIIIFIVCYLISSYAAFMARRVIKRNSSLSVHSALLASKLVKYLGILFSFMIAMAQLGIPYTALAVAGGAIAVAFGFGAQKMIADLFAGLALLMKNRIHVGDHVLLNGQYGVVKELSLYDTVLLMEDSKDLIVPNSKFFDQEFVNLTLENPNVRLTIDIGVAYDTDLKKLRTVTENVLEKSPLVQKRPYYRVVCDSFDDSAIVVKVQFFANILERSQVEVKSNIMKDITEAYRENDIVIAFPQRDVHIISEQ